MSSHRLIRARKHESDASGGFPGAEDQSPQSHDAFIRTLQQLQQQQQQTPVNLLTCWYIRMNPILATLTWTGTLFGLLFSWIFADGMARFPGTTTGVASVSTVSAQHVVLALIGDVVAAVFLVQSLAQERLLRCKRVLPEATEDRWLWFTVSIFDAFLAFSGSIALSLLPIFGPIDSPNLHKILKACFFVSLSLVGLLSTAEVEHLWHEHPDRYDLKAGTFLKYTFTGLFMGCGVTSQMLYQPCAALFGQPSEFATCYRLNTASAILEWGSCFALSGFMATLALDVWPLSRHVPVHPRFSATSQGLSHVHDQDDKIEIPASIEVRRFPVTEGTGFVGYSTGWTDRNDVQDEPEFSWFEIGKRGREGRRRRRHRVRRSSLV